MQSTDAADDHGAGMAVKTVTPKTTPGDSNEPKSSKGKAGQS